MITNRHATDTEQQTHFALPARTTGSIGIRLLPYDMAVSLFNPQPLSPIHHRFRDLGQKPYFRSPNKLNIRRAGSRSAA
jgi:hypothetical protein